MFILKIQTWRAASVTTAAKCLNDHLPRMRAQGYYQEEDETPQASLRLQQWTRATISGRDLVNESP
jgi:hypothetical protein